MPDAEGCRAAADIGGTFTDLEVMDPDGRVLTTRLLSTPDDCSRAITDGLAALVGRHGITGPAGELVHATTVGGGGWGDPFQRDPEVVRLDVWNEKLNAEQAAREYGVVLDREGRAVDAVATDRLRRRTP